jgi:hypothetical protein
LNAEIRLFRDGKLVMSKQDAPFDDGPLQLDLKRLSARGELLLKPDLEAGQYVLQIIISNALIDFEIVN